MGAIDSNSPTVCSLILHAPFFVLLNNIGAKMLGALGCSLERPGVESSAGLKLTAQSGFTILLE